MTSEEVEESQMEESGVGGPGAPTPLGALEVSSHTGIIQLKLLTRH